MDECFHALGLTLGLDTEYTSSYIPPLHKNIMFDMDFIVKGAARPYILAELLVEHVRQTWSWGIINACANMYQFLCRTMCRMLATDSYEF